MKVTQSKYAQKIGISRERVRRYVRDGLIKLHSGKVDTDEADLDLERNLDQSKRMDYEQRVNRPVGNGPPKPFTGSLVRDLSIMTLTAFYEYYLNAMGPVFLKLLVKHCHIAEKSAEDATILFAFRTHDLVKDFLEGDILNQWFEKNASIAVEDFDCLISRRPTKGTRPPRNLPIMPHGDFILGLLKKQKQK